MKISKAQTEAVRQILDANVNRAREGLRVTEEIFRFAKKDPAMTRKIKVLRHKVDAIVANSRLGKLDLEASRDSKQDPGRVLHAGREFSRGSLQDILGANLHRVGEALRVLEEFSKLFDTGASRKFKELRFRFYDVEKAALQML